MVKKIINIGVEGNDATGDAIRDAFSKVNDNFNEIYFSLTKGETGGFPFTSLSDYDPDQNQSLVPESMFIVHPTKQLILAKKLVGENTNGAGIEVDNTNADRIIIKNLGSKLVQDTTPKLGGTLDGQGQFAIGNLVDPDSEEAAIIAGRLNVSLDTFATTKGYTDANYVNITGDTMTGPLVVPADASGSQVPRKSEVVGRLGGATNAMLGDLLLYRDPLPTGSNLTAATKHYVDVNGTPSPLNFFVSTNGRTTAEMVYDGVPTEKFGRAYAYAFSSLGEACKYAEDSIFASALELGNYKQPITVGNATSLSIVNSLSTVSVDGKSLIRLIITNNNGTSPVDQGVSSNIDLIPGKLITGATSKAIGVIYAYTSVQSGYDWVDVIPKSGTFITAENLYFDSPTPKIQITINVESGIYDEHFPIRVPRNVSIIGDEMRRTIIRPKDAASASPWRTMYFSRDLLIDGVTTNPSLVLTNVGGYSAAAALILANKAFIQSEVNTYMYQINALFDSTTFISRNISSIVDALVADLTAGNNTNSVATAYTYYGNVIPSANVDICTAGIKYIKQLIPLILAKTTLGPSTSPQKLGTVSQVTSGTAGETGTTDIANKLVDTVVYGFTSGIGYHYLMDPTKPMDIGPGYAVFAGAISGTSLSISGAVSGTVEIGQFLTGIGVPRTVKIISGSGTSWTIANPDNVTVSNTTMYAHANIGGFKNAAKIILANKEFIKAQVDAYMSTTLSATYNTALSLRDVGLVVDAICDDLIKGYSAAATDAAFRYYGTAISSQNRATCYAGLNYIKQIIPFILSETQLDNTTTPTLLIGAEVAVGSLISGYSYKISTVGTTTWTNANAANNVPGMLGDVFVYDGTALTGSGKARLVADQVNDPIINAESGASTIANKLVDIVAYALSTSTTYNPPRNNKDIDLFLMNDATGLKDFSMQGHGGFAVVLDPEGQILTKSPYMQNCSSLAASINKKAFRGGAFVDGFTGRMPITITTTTGSALTQIAVSGLKFPQSRPLDGSVNRTPNTPTSFFINGRKYRINNLAAFNDSAGTATFNLGDTYSAANTSITLETAGNRSMLATHFTQVNDLGYGILATNNALVELVSVFTYYCHTAYYSLNGAQIRSVSGSNSNGFYGLKAEGSDPNEIPRSVYLADNTSQVARVYKKGSQYNASGFNATNGTLLTIVGYDYIPYSTSELQINHPNSGKTSYTINNVTPVSNTVNVKTIGKGGNGNGIITTTISHGFSTQTASGVPTVVSATGANLSFTLTVSDTSNIYQGQMVAGTNITAFTAFTGTIASGSLTTLTTAFPTISTGATLVVGTVYNIANLTGTSQLQWNTLAGTSGVTYAVGSSFTAAVTTVAGTTGTVYLSLRPGQVISNTGILSGYSGASYSIYVVSGSANTWTITNPQGITLTSASLVAQLFPKVVSVKEYVVTLDVATTGTVNGNATFYDCVTIKNVPSTVTIGGLPVTTAEFNGTFPVLSTGPGSSTASSTYNQITALSFTSTSSSIANNAFTSTGSSIAGTTLTIGTIVTGAVVIGQIITGTGIVAGTYVVSGTGLSWQVSLTNTVTNIAINGSGSVLTVGGTTTGTVAVGQVISGTGITGSCIITASVSGAIWAISNPNSITVTSIAIDGKGIGTAVVSFTGTISGTVLTVPNNTAIAVGMTLVGGAVLSNDNVTVTSIGTIGATTTTWNITNTNSRSVAGIAMTGYANGLAGQNSFSLISDAGSTANLTDFNSSFSRTNSGTIYIIFTQGDTNWTAIGSSSNSPGTVFIYNGNPVTGTTGKAYQSPISPGQILTSSANSFNSPIIPVYVTRVATQGFVRANDGRITATVTVSTPFVSNASGTYTFTQENAGTQFNIPLSVGTVDTYTTTTSVTATLNTKIAKISLGTGIDGASTKFTDNMNDGDWVVIRAAQNFKFYGNFLELSARPSTSLDFTYDNDISTYRTIGLSSSYYDNTKLPNDADYGRSLTLNEQPSLGTTVFVNVDTGFAYISATVANLDAIGGATTIRIVELAVGDQARVVGMEFGWADQNTTAKGFKRTVTAYTAPVSPATYATLTLDSALPTYTKIPTGTSISLGIKSYGASTLATNIASTGEVLTIVLASNAAFSRNGTYTRYVKIDDEIFSFTGISGSTTLTGVVRTRLGTVAAAHTTPATVREISGLLTANISTNRVTSHDFLNIGTGGFNTSNYPNNIYGVPVEAKVDNASSVDSKGGNAKAEVQEKSKGRVFFASTNQDGFFRVGKFFTVDQGTGTVSFNASIVLSGISGIGFKRGTFVAEFSPDATMPDIGDAVPTNSAVRAYVDSRLGVDLNNTIATSIIGVGGGFLPLNPPSGVYMKSTLDMGGQKISRVATPVAGTDAPNKNYVDSALVSTNTTRVGVLAFKLADSGIGPTGNNLDINSNKIINLTGPTGPYDAANKAYVDGRAYIAQLSDVLVTTPTGPTGNDHFVYSGSSSKWVNARTAGDVLGALTATGPTGNTLTYTIQAGAIVDSKVSATAAILQSKLALDGSNPSYASYFNITGFSSNGTTVTLSFSTPLQLDGVTPITDQAFYTGQRVGIRGLSISGLNGTFLLTGATANLSGTSTISYANSTAGSPTATAGVYGSISPIRGIVTLDANQFSVNGGLIINDPVLCPGFASIKVNGLKLDRLVPIAGNTVVGNSNSNATTPSATAFTSVVENSLSSSYSSTVGPTGALAVGAGVLVRGAGAGNFGTVAYGPTGAANTIVQRDANGDFAARNIAATNITATGSLSVTGPVINWGSLTVGGRITRTAASTGYLDGNYTTGGETTATPGVIYTIGGTSSPGSGYIGYVPNATNLGNMYGIGYTYTNSGAARTTLNGGLGVGFQTSTTGLKIPDNLWGQYVAGAGSVFMFFGSDGIIYGTAAQAKYADLAEDYAGDQQYEPGTVLMIGGEQEVTLAKGQGTRKVVGVVSTKPAYHMNRGLEAEFSIAVALQGRVPCKVIGKVSKGDMMVVSMVPGVAMASEDPKAGSIIGKALADYDSDRVGVIEVLVGKH